MLTSNTTSYCIINDNTEPYFNLALEEYLLKETSNNYFMLWRNQPCVVVGRNQDTITEINSSYLEAHNIKVVRRLSGGGAVFHDTGNFNFSFITNDVASSLHNFSKFTMPIIEVLNQLGIKAKLSQRNDLLVANTRQKFSGNAQYVHKGRLLHHGTILFNTAIDVMIASLKTNPSNFSKGVRSVSSCVTNIQDHLTQVLTAEEFKVRLHNHIIAKQNYINYYLTATEIEKIAKLAINKYSTWEWNYGARSNNN